jgi:hypothetical protein
MRDGAMAHVLTRVQRENGVYSHGVQSGWWLVAGGWWLVIESDR